MVDTSDNRMQSKKTNENIASYGGEFESYLVSALNDSLIKKNQIKNLQFTSWWIENGEKNLITVVFQLDGNPHEIIIKDTKYYVKELYSADKRNTTQLACWDLFVGAQVDIFGKSTVFKQCDLKTAEWNKFYSSFLTEMKNTFIEELKKYERKALDVWVTKSHSGSQQASANLRKLI